MPIPAFIACCARRALPCLLALAPILPARADAPAPAPLANYHHSRWTADEGAPPTIRAMAQTTDGWLWLGTLDGLYRFDGVQFSRHALPPGLGLNRNLIRYLHAGPRGELYIGRSAEGIAVLHPDGRLKELPPGPAVGSIASAVGVDADGSLWMAGRGIHRLQAGRWRAVEDGPEWRALDVRNFSLDSEGRLWLSRQSSTWRLDRETGRFVRVLDQGGDLLPAPDGALWLMSDDGSLRRLAAPGANRPVPVSREAADTGQFAPDGTLWTLACAGMPCPLPGAAAHAESAWRIAPARLASSSGSVQLSGKAPYAMLVDREGNAWVATENGIDRFRRKRILPTELAGEGTAYSLASDASGRVWAAHHLTGEMWQLLPEGALPARPGRPVTVLARDPAGALLLGGRRSIRRERGGVVEEIPLPPGPGGKAMDLRMLGILDDGKILWTATVETGLLAWRDGRWHTPEGFNMPKKIYQSALAGPGRLWLATGDGELFHYDVEQRRSAAPVDIRALGMTAAIFPGPELVLSGDNGSGVVRDGRLAMLRAADPNALRNVSGLVASADGDRWLNGAAGLVHVHAADWRRSIADPAIPLRYEVFDRLDGYPGRAVFENRWRSAWSADGRHLWLAASGGVVRIDTANIERNRIAPTPVILSLSTDRKTVHAGRPGQASLRLPPGTARLRFDFTAPSLRMPERVRFEYMLEGVDSGWQNAGTRRSTSYTSVGPGDYVFRVRAVNEDGVPSKADAVMPLAIAPALWQTLSFRLVAALLAGALLAAAYRYRVRYLTRRAAERAHVQLAERERIARTLHDTFLQTVHSLMLRLDALAAGLPTGDRARRELEKVLDHAGSALSEGREQLRELRSGEGVRLEDLLARVVGRLQGTHSGIGIGLRVEGPRRPLAPDVVGEAAAIATEALHNACLHAGASQVRVRVDHGGAQLVVCVMDDGRGIEAEGARKGAAEGHWGLVGMRERAQRIGAVLDVAPGPDGGTVVRLTVPASRAYPAATAG
ncbi:sensor histidine kinase [Massilia sp. BKSP1R2A-1]|uniref:sensor histidine kinase n=1 Tax=Massilia sp. BKSP1R2A-1 TaxID=3422595 RepID=UPI003D336EDA